MNGSLLMNVVSSVDVVCLLLCAAKVMVAERSLMMVQVRPTVANPNSRWEPNYHDMSCPCFITFEKGRINKSWHLDLLISKLGKKDFIQTALRGTSLRVRKAGHCVCGHKFLHPPDDKNGSGHN